MSMILLGQYDSPFVRRVAIALHLYDFAFEHRPWSTFADADKIASFNPLRRVPTLVLDDGAVIIESAYILDHLDEQVGERRAMIARSGPARRRALYICALATGLADKAVSLVYEKALHEEVSGVWLDRCRTQIGAVLDVLEAERAKTPAPWWFGQTPGHADVAVACALRFVTEAHPALFGVEDWPNLGRHHQACEALEVFKSVAQPFIPPK